VARGQISRSETGATGSLGEAEGRKARAAGEPWWQIYAIGHSTLPRDELIERLYAHEVATLADVRTVPRSRANPQFNRDELARELPLVGIRYEHLADLGGLRHSKLGEASPNDAWRNASFRSYADYMLSPDFERGLDALLELASEAPVAMMCAEALPWRCHRSLIADALFARGITVRHIWSATRAEPHQLTRFAHVEGTRVTYPAEPVA
jgi:uncharacterized protein (DUF488 family)